MPCGTDGAAPRNRGRVMISYTDIEKLLATRSENPPVLSLYLEVPLDPSVLRGLPARAGELLDSAAAGPCGPDSPDAGRALAEARREARRFLADSARDWLGHCVAIFICGPAGLAEAIPLPAGLGEQAVFGPRPHVRPLLVAIQRHPAYRVAVVNRRHAWLFTVAGNQIDMVTQPAAAGVAAPATAAGTGWSPTGSTSASPSSRAITSTTPPPSSPRPSTPDTNNW